MMNDYDNYYSLLDIMSIVSFVIGIANYNENLTQADKADLMSAFDNQTSQLIIALSDKIDGLIKRLEDECVFVVKDK